MSECEICNGTGYVFFEQGDKAQSKLCTCSEICPICNGTGLITVEKNSYLFEKQCSCSSIRQKISLFNRAGVPRRFAKCELDNYYNKGGNQNQIKYEIIDFIHRLNTDDGRGILLSGTTGTGKTHLAVSILKYSIFDLGLKAVFIDFFELTGMIKAGYNRGISEMNLLLPLLSNDLICIDELGKGRNTEWELGILDQFISKAYNSKKILIVTTNYPIIGNSSDNFIDNSTMITETLKQRTGPRIFSRLIGMCNFLTVIGPDAREI